MVGGQSRRPGVKRTERSERRTIAADDRHGQVTFDAELCDPRMPAESCILAGILDDERRDRAADERSIGLCNVEVLASFEPQSRVINN